MTWLLGIAARQVDAFRIVYAMNHLALGRPGRRTPPCGAERRRNQLSSTALEGREVVQ